MNNENNMVHTSVDTFSESTEGKKTNNKRKDYILVPLSAIGAWYPAEVAIANHHVTSTYHNIASGEACVALTWLC
jgi:hypothetical protein